MMESKVHITLGSNLGDKEGNIIKAAGRIGSLPGSRIIAVSDLYISDPVGENLSGCFINAAICVATSLGIKELHRHFLQIEAELGKKKTPDNEDRAIDIDIIFFDGHEGEFDGITLPHPRYSRRLFVLQPLLDMPGTLDEARLEEVRGHAGELLRAKGPLCLRFKSMIY